MSHTPGPWRFSVDDGDRKILMPHKIIGEDTQMCDTTYYPWCPDNNDDWQLIAAAPDLFEAIKEYLEWGAMTGSDRDLFDDKFKAAIAKAEGR